MKASHEFRRHTYASLIDWRIDCHKLRHTHMPHVGAMLLPAVSDIAKLRLTAAIQPYFDSLDRICNLLKSLKYVIVLALLLSGSQAEARYRHVHHHSSVDRTVRVYDPPRVEARDTAEQVASVFDTGYYELRYPNLDISRELYVTPPHIDTTPPPVVESTPIPDNTDTYGRMVLAVGVMVLICGAGIGVTGPPTPTCDCPDNECHGYPEVCTMGGYQTDVVTLVETRRYLPLWVSSAYLVVKHYLRLR